MTKKELTEEMQKEATIHYSAGVSKVVIEAVLTSLGVVGAKELVKGGDVTLPGLGKLVVERKAARKGRNPGTGEVIDIPARRVVRFVAASALKDAVKGS